MPARTTAKTAPRRRTLTRQVAAKLAELNDDEDAVRIYLLTDEPGAAMIARGVLPDYVKRQARAALRPWSQFKTRG
jgi:hypothetical protein